MASSQKRIIVVTGANKGIGYAAIQDLMKLPEKYEIILTSRNEELGKQAVKQLLEETPEYKDSLHHHQLDVVDDQSVDKFRDWLKEKFGKLDVLVNSAGAISDGEVTGTHYHPTQADFDEVIGTNYLKLRELTEKLLPLLSQDGKIISMTSLMGGWEVQGETARQILIRPNFDDKDLQELTETYRKALLEKRLIDSGLTPTPYKMSKALLCAWNAYVLPKYLKGDQQGFAVCPLVCDTDILRKANTGPLLKELKYELHTAHQGADTVVYLISLPYKRDDSINGKVLRERKVRDYYTLFNI